MRAIHSQQATTTASTTISLTNTCERAYLDRVSDFARNLQLPIDNTDCNAFSIVIAVTLSN